MTHKARPNIPRHTMRIAGIHPAAFIRNILVIVILTLGLWPLFMEQGGFLPAIDAGDQMLPFTVETKRMLASGAPWWSWNTYLGENFIAGYAYYTVTSPFAWLCCLVPYRYMLIAFTVALYLKFLVCSWVADVYLRRMGANRRLSTIGSLLFTFSSWMTVQLSYAFFVEPVIAYLLLLICIEKFLDKERYGALCLILSAFAVAFANYYFMPQSLMCGMIYFFARIWARGVNDKLSTTFKAAGCVVTGILIASVVLVPTAIYVLGTEREMFPTGAFNYLERVRSLFMPLHMDGKLAIYWQYTGFNMNTANIVIFGMLPALYVIIKTPRNWLSILLIVFTGMYITHLGGIFSLGTSAMYSRWLYALIILQTLATVRFLDDFANNRVPWKVLGWYLALVLLLYACTAGLSLALDTLAYYPEIPIDLGHLIVIGVMFGVGIVLLVPACRMRILSNRWYVFTLSAIVVCASLQIFCFCMARGTNTPLARYPDAELLNPRRLAEYDANLPFNHRTAYLAEGSYFNRNVSNPTVTHNTPGMSTFHSVRAGKIQPMVARFDDTGNPVVFAPSRERALLYTMMSVKTVRIIDDGNGTPSDLPEMRYLGQYDQYEEYEFPYFTPPGMVFPTIDDVNRAWEMTDTAQMRVLAESQQRHHAEFAGDTRGFIAAVTLDSAGVIMYPVPAVDGFKAYVDGEIVPIEEDAWGMAVIKAGPGRHNIRFEYLPPGLIPGAILSLLALIATAWVAVKKW